ncbi:hypothetical protein B0H15DRAFT_296796 [Mycena belliarum]|uniref:G-protein coupled receptors family 2 profile 2 domain-containing protein n=1 Tax=Mycena belliarum TaxID=1033014 RepID=A0AAD6XUE5_9AGAR|nr:hypothetical protein B0H15DRAFT_296796 [Mycena belliae]
MMVPSADKAQAQLLRTILGCPLFPSMIVLPEPHVRLAGDFENKAFLQALSEPHVPGDFDNHIGTMFQTLTITGLCLTFLILCGFAYTALHSASKHHLNRVSFRLLTYALLANLVYGCAFVSTGDSIGPSTSCSLTVFLINLTVLFSGGICFCIAINLELVLVHGCNGKRLEKYYILGTIALCTICTTPPYAAGQFGWNEQSQGCWFSNPDQRALVRWIIGTHSFWVLFMAVGEAIAFFLIVRYFVSFESNQRRVHSGSTSSGNGTFMSEHQPRSPMVQYRNPMGQYRNIILRVGLYPLVSCILSMGTVIDLFLVVDEISHPIVSELNFRLSIASLCIYSLRPVIYAVLAASDPSFIRAVQELRRPTEQLTVLQLQTSGLRGRFTSTQTASPGEGLHIGFPSDAVTHSVDAAGNALTHPSTDAPKEAPQSQSSESKVGIEHLSAAVIIPEVNAWDIAGDQDMRRPALQVRARRGPAPRMDVVSHI